jgi:hypothetical protein
MKYIAKLKSLYSDYTISRGQGFRHQNLKYAPNDNGLHKELQSMTITLF